TQGDAPGALRAAGERVLRGVVKAQRYVAAPIEPRAYAADWDPYANLLTVWSSTQNPHPLRVFLAGTLVMPETSIRVIQPHADGGCGQKGPTCAEEVCIAYLSRKLGRPIKWIEERTEHFLAGGHAREERITFEAAYLPNGRVTALDVRIVADVGVPATFCGWAMSYATACCVPAPSKLPTSSTHPP